jgi:hypothetical protein
MAGDHPSHDGLFSQVPGRRPRAERAIRKLHGRSDVWTREIARATEKTIRLQRALVIGGVGAIHPADGAPRIAL